MKLFSQIVISIMFFAFLSGCSVPLTCVLFNNTTSTLTIEQKDSINTVLPGRIVSLKYWGSKVKITSEQNTWSYRPAFVPGDYFHMKGWLWPWGVKRIAYAQIEPDGSIYLLTKKNKKPTTDFPAQPEGYPLQPE